jgi:hypothetical protein
VTKLLQSFFEELTMQKKKLGVSITHYGVSITHYRKFSAGADRLLSMNE